MLSILYLTTILSGAVTLKNCGAVGDVAQITSMGFFPTNPVSGDKTELWIAYNLNEELSGGTATYSTTFNGIPFSPTIEDLCTQTSCPKSAGFYNETSLSDFPSGISGKIVNKIQWKDQDEKPVWCAEVTLKV
jgi:hypothetical protein